MFFFSFFGVGLGAVLVVHIFDGFPDKKLVRRDLKFFAKFANGGTVKRSSICRLFISFESAKIRPHRLPFSAVEEGHSSEKQDGVRMVRRSRGRENLLSSVESKMAASRLPVEEESARTRLQKLS